MPPKSVIWSYFVKGDAIAKCKICQLNVKTSGNTTNLHFHMHRSHPNVDIGHNKELILTRNKESAVSLKRKQMVIY